MMGNTMEIIPLIGLKIGDKLINLQDSKKKVIAVLGEPCDEWENSFFYFDNELRIDFDERGCVEFIEFLAGIDGKTNPQIYGVKAFQETADALYDILARENAGDIEDEEDGYSYGFLNISVGVFRDTLPEDVMEMIEEAQEDGEPMSEEDIAFEMRKATHWDTIGIGVKNYYK